MYLWPWLKMSIFLTEISCFWRRNEIGGQNVDGRNIQKSEENQRNISLYFDLFRRFFEKIDALHLY